jgi:lipooligosaccharide transport system permease protein
VPVADFPAARVVEREARAFSKLWRGSVFSSVLTPVLYLGAMGLGLGSLVDAHNNGGVSGMSYLVFVAPGLLAAGTTISAAGEAMWPIMGGFKWGRQYHAIAAAVPSARDIYDGVMVWRGILVAMSAAAFLVVAALLGAIPSAWGVLALPAAVLGALAIAAPLAGYVATRDSDVTFVVIYRLAVFPLFLFSGTFFPVSLLPSSVRWLVVISPLWHTVELCRGATTGHLGWSAIVHVAVLVACVAAGRWWGHRTFARKLAP